MGFASATHTSLTDTAAHKQFRYVLPSQRAHRAEPKRHVADPIHRVPANGGGGGGGAREYTVKQEVEGSKAFRAASYEGVQMPPYVATLSTLE